MDEFPEILELREWLGPRKGKWSEISRRSGVSLKTIYRILNEPGYSLSSRTLAALRETRDRMLKVEQFEASLT